MNNFWSQHFNALSTEENKDFLNLSSEILPEILSGYDLSSKKIKTYESVENRVFGFDDVIIKFYRPGRWSFEAIQEEVLFLNDLKDDGVAVSIPKGDVQTWKGIHYLAYHSVEKPFNESPDVLSEENVKKLSHLLAQVHKTGARREAKHRASFNPEQMCSGCYDVIQRAGFLPKEFEKRYEDLLSKIISRLDEFKDVPIQRIHGDAYSGNVVWRNENPILLDFDDFQVGPTAIDLKLLSFPWRLDSLSEEMNRKERREIQNQLVLKYYREINEFPKEWERMFPLMSAYRDIQFDAWFSSRWSEPGFAKKYEDDDITDPEWWSDNMEGLESLL